MKPTPFKLTMLVAACLPTACTNLNPDHVQQRPIEQLTHYAPGLGEIMTQTASRHAKLWFAGQGQNWALAAYEVDELREGMDDAIKYHPTHKHIRQPIDELIAQTMSQPLDAIDQALKNRSSVDFQSSYDQLTAACNACHQISDFDFIVVTRPRFNPFANQAF